MNIPLDYPPFPVASRQLVSKLDHPKMQEPTGLWATVSYVSIFVYSFTLQANKRPTS